MLKIDSVTKRYRGENGPIDALCEASLAIDGGELVAVRGPSGSGKSTLLMTAGGLLHPDEGTVVLDGVDLYAIGANARAIERGRKIGFVFQRFHLIPYLTVRENVLSAAIAVGRANDSPYPEVLEARADALLAELEMTDRRSHLPHQLSTGQRQRTALARALLLRPSVLLADEPTGNLDPDAATVVMHHLSAFAKAGGAVLLVTHHPDAVAMADRVVRIQAGKLTDA